MKRSLCYVCKNLLKLNEGSNEKEVVLSCKAFNKELGFVDNNGFYIFDEGILKCEEYNDKFL